MDVHFFLLMLRWNRQIGANKALLDAIRDISGDAAGPGTRVT